jgi:hypothetical protein
MFRKKPVPLDEQLGYELADISGYQCQCTENATVINGPRTLFLNPSGQVPVVMYYETDQTVTGISMQTDRWFNSPDVTPNPYETRRVEPNYDRRYTVIPVPEMGLFGVTMFDDLNVGY